MLTFQELEDECSRPAGYWSSKLRDKEYKLATTQKEYLEVI